MHAGPSATGSRNGPNSAFVLHAAALGAMIAGYKGLQGTEHDKWVQTQTGGRFQFLTMNGLMVAIFTILTSIAADVVPSSLLFKRTKRLLAMIALPLGIVISSIYWTLLALAPTLVLTPAETMGMGERAYSSSRPMPEFTRIPLRVDLAVHAVPALSLAADFYLFEAPYSTRDAGRGAPAVCVAAGVLYALWVEYCARHNGNFPYPFLTHSPFSVRVAIYAAGSIMAYASFQAINGLHPRAPAASKKGKKAQ